MQDRWSALHIAVGRNNTCAIGALLVAKVDVDATTTAGWTPLMLAEVDEHQPAVCALRRHGVDVDAKCVLGNTAADYALHPLVAAPPIEHRNVVSPALRLPLTYCNVRDRWSAVGASQESRVQGQCQSTESTQPMPEVDEERAFDTPRC